MTTTTSAPAAFAAVLCGRRAGTRVREAHPVEVRDRVEDALVAAVSDVVVGERHDVDAGVLDARQQLRIEGEHQAVRPVDVVVRRRALEIHER
jgi:hypothetical protein